MYIRHIRIENTKKIHGFTWVLEDSESPFGWHSITGDNGSGKTTLLQTVVVAMEGQKHREMVKGSWINRSGKSGGSIIVKLVDRDGSHLFPQLQFYTGMETQETQFLFRKTLSEKSGFCASYSFTNGEGEPIPHYSLLCRESPKLARHATLFGRTVDLLSEGEQWLSSLYRSGKESRTVFEKTLVLLNTFWDKDSNGNWEFVNDSNGKLFLESKSIHVADQQIPIRELSTGHKKVVRVVIDLVRHMVHHYGNDVFNVDGSQIVRPGIILLDDVGNNLHLVLQKKIGWMFVQAFPQVQFIITTHSAFVAQASYHGTVHRLDNTSDSFDEFSGRMPDYPYRQLVYGSSTQAMGSGVFGYDVNVRLPHSSNLLKRLNELYTKEKSNTLADGELEELVHLENLFNFDTRFSIRQSIRNESNKDKNNTVLE